MVLSIIRELDDSYDAKPDLGDMVVSSRVQCYCQQERGGLDVS